MSRTVLLPLVLAAATGHAQQFAFHHAVVPPPGPGLLEGKTGWTLAVNADHVISGAPLADDQGHVLVWNTAGFLPGSDLSSEVIDDPGPGTPGLFGASIACQGNTLAVGHCSALDDGYCDDATDRVSLFELIDGTWSALPNIGRPAWVHGTFGHALAMHGDRLAVGAYRSNVTGAELPIVYLYHRSIDQWSPQPTDSLLGATDGADRFGTALAMDESHLLIGAFRDSELGEKAGAAYIFRLDQDSVEHWTLLRKLLASNGTAFDGFGRALALDGDQCVIGAPFHLIDTLTAGAVYHFMRDAGFPDNWGESQMVSPMEPRNGMGFGESLALLNDVLAVGSPEDVLSFPGQSGSLDVYTFDGTAWDPLQHLSPTDDELVSVGSRCAQSLALVDDALLVGAPWAWIPGQTTATSGGVLVYTQEPIGLKENNRSGLTMWPVPATDRLSIAVGSAHLGPSRCTFHDALGRSVMLPSIGGPSGTRSFSVSGLSPGIWSVTLTDDRSGAVIGRGAFVRE